jgi:hypothetical protein
LLHIELLLVQRVPLALVSVNQAGAG